MASYIHGAVFGVYPYVALAVLILGSALRYDRDPYTWRSGSSQLLRRRQLIWGSVLFHLGVLVIFAGHLVGLLTPIQVFDTLGISHGAKQLGARPLLSQLHLGCLLLGEAAAKQHKERSSSSPKTNDCPKYSG